MLNSEVVACYGQGCTLLRSDITTLRIDVDQSSNVVEGWALLLNVLEFGEDSKPSKLYMGIQHSVSLYFYFFISTYFFLSNDVLFTF